MIHCSSIKLHHGKQFIQKGQIRALDRSIRRIINNFVEAQKLQKAYI
jgi:hypothetical protein